MNNKVLKAPPGDRLEPAIPAHLRTVRTTQSEMPNGFKPTASSYSARFDSSVSVTPMLYVGVQDRRGGVAIDELLANHLARFAGPNGPAHFDRATYVDERGYPNSLFACYWRSRTTYRLWRAAQEDGWWHSADLDSDIGHFLEAYTPGVEDTETTFSHPVSEGFATVADHFSEPTDSHEYWGSARDRIARSQTDPLQPSGEPTTRDTMPQDSLGHLVHVEAAQNLFLLRSGQDWTDTEGAERAFYLDRVQPVLQEGMIEIRDSGHELGCYFNRFMTVTPPGVELSECTYSLSAWRSLADIEHWCRQNTHLKIFGAGIQHYRQAGEAAQLRLYHEASVLQATDQEFAYFNCHNKTGMLNALNWT